MVSTSVHGFGAVLVVSFVTELSGKKVCNVDVSFVNFFEFFFVFFNFLCFELVFIFILLS